VLVALYGFCLVVPSLALALGDNSAHCLTDENHHQASSMHVHADGTAHVHASATDEHDPDGATDQTGHTRNCCGLACLSAIAPVIQVDLFDQVRFTTVTASIADEVPGRAPDRLYRPPISL
jgi:hypothetical protein